MAEPYLCARCGVPATTDEERLLCGHCFWAVKAEVERELTQLVEYLRGWDRFRDWERSRSDSAGEQAGE